MLFAVRIVKKGDYFAKNFRRLFGKKWFTSKIWCDILQNGEFFLALLFLESKLQMKLYISDFEKGGSIL